MTSDIISIARPPSASGLSKIDVDQTPRRDQIDNIRDALVESNIPLPVYYVLDGRLHRIDCTSGRPVPVPVEAASLAEFALRAFDWTRVEKGGVKHVDPPATVVRAVFAAPGDRLPQLRKTVRAPFIIATGRVVDQPGYDAESQMYLYLDQPFDPVPESPTGEEFAEAVHLLVHESFDGFRFRDQASRANAVAAHLTQDLKDLYPGLRAPVFAVDAPGNNQGKTTFAQVIAIPRYRDEIPVTHAALADKAETRRTVFAVLAGRPDSIVLDNVEDPVASAALASVLTSKSVQDRAIKTSTAPTVVNTPLWLVTGAFLAFVRELALRSALIQLTGDPHGTRIDPIPWTVEHSLAIVRARLIVLRYWIERGRPLSRHTHPKFTRWAQIIGGVLELMGVMDFLGNQNVLLSKDEESASWDDLVLRWAALSNGPATPRSATEILHQAVLPGEPAWDLVDRGRDELGRTQILGKALAKRVGVAISGWVIRSAPNTHVGASRYWLDPVAPPPLPTPPSPPPRPSNPPPVRSSPPASRATGADGPASGVCGVSVPSPKGISRSARARGRDQESPNPANPADRSDQCSERPTFDRRTEAANQMLVDWFERHKKGRGA